MFFRKRRLLNEEAGGDFMEKPSNVFARVEFVKQLLVMEELSKEELNAEISEGMADIENGRVCSAEEVFEEMHRSYGI